MSARPRAGQTGMPIACSRVRAPVAARRWASAHALEDHDLVAVVDLEALDRIGRVGLEEVEHVGARDAEQRSAERLEGLDPIAEGDPQFSVVEHDLGLVSRVPVAVGAHEPPGRRLVQRPHTERRGLSEGLAIVAHQHVLLHPDKVVAGTEPLIVVEVPSSSRGRRADFTPPWDGGPADAQADRYFEFLRTEALPAIAEAYRVGETQVLVGNSLGGLFALYALLADPLLFEGYFAFSPSVWIVDEEILRELEGATGRELQAPTSLYLSLGDAEGNEMLSGFESVRTTLTSWAGFRLRWHAEITANADHRSNPVLSFPAALRWFSGA